MGLNVDSSCIIMTVDWNFSTWAKPKANPFIVLIKSHLLLLQSLRGLTVYKINHIRWILLVMGHLLDGKTDLCLRAFSLDTCLDNILRKTTNKQKQKALYLIVNVFGIKAPIEDAIRTSLCCDGAAIIRLVPSFLSSFSIPSIDPALRIEPDDHPLSAGKRPTV